MDIDVQSKEQLAERNFLAVRKQRVWAEEHGIPASVVLATFVETVSNLLAWELGRKAAANALSEASDIIRAGRALSHGDIVALVADEPEATPDESPTKTRGSQRTGRFTSLDEDEDNDDDEDDRTSFP